MQPCGIYEQLITKLVADKFEHYKKITVDDAGLVKRFHIEQQSLDPGDAAVYLANYLQKLVRFLLDALPSTHKLEKQLKLANALIVWLAEYLRQEDIKENLLDTQNHLLKAFYDSTKHAFRDFEKHIKRITPLTGLTQSELFTGSNIGLSLDSELKREMLSSNEIWLLVAFIKWTGIRVFADELKEATANGTKLKVITTSYMGATDQKAVDFLANLPNTEVRLSYNTQRERLHAKAYIFLRDSGFDTGYIGSSNISRSALTNGLEWNLKVTYGEVPHILQKFKSTFETYWQSPDFEAYDANCTAAVTRLRNALNLERKGSSSEGDNQEFYFDLEPHAYQKEMLEKLRVERHLHKRWRNLIVAATGTGKTLISAFDFRSIYKQNPATRLLFVAHREEILRQARASFRAVLRDANFGELWVGATEPEYLNHVFVSVQTLKNRIELMQQNAEWFDYIIIDEVHHIAAESYRPILEKFAPKILLGLTATPERHDGANILDDFCGTIAAELRLPEAINQRYLCPFQYFVLDDTVSLADDKLWKNGRYLPGELTKLYNGNDIRAMAIYNAMQEIIGNLTSIKALAFCVTKEHATYMAEKFCLMGIKSAVLTSDNSKDRLDLRKQLSNGKINILCVVDIFNEGVDIPEVDTLLFLRPTESLTIFLQQFGRGLRLCPDKECLTVLDFVGNANSNYDFAGKFRALVGKTHTPISNEISNNFPHLPLGCSIVMQKQAKEVILNNIQQAIASKDKVLRWIKNWPHQTNEELTLTNFLKLHPQMRIEDLYRIKINKGGGWSRMLAEAGVLEQKLDEQIETAMCRAIRDRFLQSNSSSYLEFLYQLLDTGNWDSTCQIQNQMAMMAYYDFWQKPGSSLGFSDLSSALSLLSKDPNLRKECLDVLTLLIEQIDTEELDMPFHRPLALKLHSRYSRDQILAAFNQHSFDKRSSSREGVLDIAADNCELLFVTLQKTEDKFSPTTLYEDYAINDILFHWQSQNSARPDKGKGLSYIEHFERNKRIILFVREQTHDAYGRTMGFINLGLVNIKSHQGSQPMSIVWKLEEAMPAYLWKNAAKLAIG